MRKIDIVPQILKERTNTGMILSILPNIALSKIIKPPNGKMFAMTKITLPSNTSNNSLPESFT